MSPTTQAQRTTRHAPEHHAEDRSVLVRTFPIERASPPCMPRSPIRTGVTQMGTLQTAWALVLAGGDGTRLRALTTAPCGTPVPKQFCSLQGNRSLLEDAIERARAVVSNDRICTVVTQSHRRWWSEINGTNQTPQRNLIVQPLNRGTAIGVVYSLLHILSWDSSARVLLLPADHYVREEWVVSAALRSALRHVSRHEENVYLLGFEPDEIDTELGYIVPGERDRGSGYSVARFVEKPTSDVAGALISQGGLWNAFIVATSARTLLQLFAQRCESLLKELEVAVARHLTANDSSDSWQAMLDLYEVMPSIDFCRDLLQGQEKYLRVLRVPHCGWSDLGTPRRVGQTLRRLPSYTSCAVVAPSGYINLAAQHERLGFGA